MQIHAAFDGGNIEVLSILANSAQLAIKPDAHASYRQWFYFCVSATPHQTQTLQLLQVKDSSYPEGWLGYQAVASHDRIHWFRVPTEFDGEHLLIRYQPTQVLTFYAYFEPYSYERYLDFIARVQNHCSLATIGTSGDGRPLHLLTIGEPAPTKKKLWFIARQHAGEIMASWFIEGLVNKLLNSHDPQVKQLLAEAVVYIVPHMNPDGAVRGHLRANAHGIDLNRQWHNPDPTLAPEVFAVRQHMIATGMDFFMDVHGDESIPHVFLAYEPALPSFTERQGALCQAFSDNLLQLSGDFQDKWGYEKGAFAEASLTLATNHLAGAFDCVAFTLEMPFKDHLDCPDLTYGWSKERSALLAEAVIQALVPLTPQLR